MKNFFRIVNEVIEKADILLLLIDARMVEQTRNEAVEKTVTESKKPFIFVVTKSDLIENAEYLRTLKKQLHPCVFVSSTKHYGTTKLRNSILIEAKRAGIEKKPLQAGVIGYPNVGKSSLINSMGKTSKTSASSMSGHTKALQKVKGDNRIVFLDTPGVIPKAQQSKKHENSQIITGSIDYTKVKDPEGAVFNLMEKYSGLLQRYYHIEPGNDLDDDLENIAHKYNFLRKKGLVDTKRAAYMILKDWQENKISID